MDISSEMIHALLPLFMSTTLGASAVWIGLTEGVGESAALISKVFSGVIADTFGKKKWLVFTGYALGVLSKPFFALATCMPVVFAARFFDRIGKGIRGAPRDAIVAEVTAESVRGAAYGLRQSLDAAGAFIGPALATILLMFFTENYRTVFWLALIPGLCCLALILFGVENVETEKQRVKEPLKFKAFFLQTSLAFKCLLVIGVVFSLARFSNAFMILRAADSGVPGGPRSAHIGRKQSCVCRLELPIGQTGRSHPVVKTPGFRSSLSDRLRLCLRVVANTLCGCRRRRAFWITPGRLTRYFLHDGR